MASNYAEKLKDPRWQKKRLLIFERDNWTCQLCSDTDSTLVVHHRLYLPNMEPWDYPDEFLVTLCESCHALEGESMSGAIQSLSDEIRKKLYSDDVYRIAHGMRELKLLHASEVVATAYDEALSDPELQRKLIKRLWIR